MKRKTHAVHRGALSFTIAARVLPLSPAFVTRSCRRVLAGKACVVPVELVWESRGVYRRYVGDVTIAERLQSFNAICGDPRFDELDYVITDYGAVAHYAIDPKETELIAALHVAPLRTNPRVVIAAVAARPDIVAAIRHFIELRFTTRPYCVFRTLAEARAWVASQPVLPCQGA